MRKYIVFGTIFITVLYLFIFYLYKSQKITYYAKLEKVSTSGEARFRPYDTKLQKVIDPDNPYSWFWGMPKNILNDSIASDNWVRYLQENNDSIFKITGTKGKPDCDYWDKDHCIDNIDVEIIDILH